MCLKRNLYTVSTSPYTETPHALSLSVLTHVRMHKHTVFCLESDGIEGRSCGPSQENVNALGSDLSGGTEWTLAANALSH